MAKDCYPSEEIINGKGVSNVALLQVRQ